MKKTLNEAATKAEVLDRVRKLTPDSVRQWGQMSVHQMVCHLNEAYVLAMGERKVQDKSNFFSRSVMRVVALNMPTKWPPGVKTVPELDYAVGGGAPLAVFEADRTALVACIERFSAAQRDFEFAPHPIFGRMSEWEWMRWGYLHADHHLRQFGV